MITKQVIAIHGIFSLLFALAYTWAASAKVEILMDGYPYSYYSTLFCTFICSLFAPFLLMVTIEDVIDRAKAQGSDTMTAFKCLSRDLVFLTVFGFIVGTNLGLLYFALLY